MAELDKDKKPVFKHDCSSCEYLGKLAAFTPLPGEPPGYDVYRCPGSVLGPSYIARFGNIDFEYWSMPYDILKTVPRDPENTTRLLRAMQRLAIAHEATVNPPGIRDIAEEMFDYISGALEETNKERVVLMFRGIDHLWLRWKRGLEADKKGKE